MCNLSQVSFSMAQVDDGQTLIYDTLDADLIWRVLDFFCKCWVNRGLVLEASLHPQVETCRTRVRRLIFYKQRPLQTACTNTALGGSNLATVFWTSWDCWLQ